MIFQGDNMDDILSKIMDSGSPEISIPSGPQRVIIFKDDPEEKSKVYCLLPGGGVQFMYSPTVMEGMGLTPASTAASYTAPRNSVELASAGKSSEAWRRASIVGVKARSRAASISEGVGLASRGDAGSSNFDTFSSVIGVPTRPA